MTNFNNLLLVKETKIKGKLQQTVSAKALHFYLKVANDFFTWIKARIKEYGLIKDSDFFIFDSLECGNQNKNNKPSIKCMTKQEVDSKSIDYILTIGTAKELAIIENNEHAQAIRNYLISCEQKKEVKRSKARNEVASYSRPMCDALILHRLSLGKETKPHNYTNEFNMINSIVLGMTAKTFRKIHDIAGEIRNHLNEQQLSHIAYLERSNITLLELGWRYERRKAELSKLSKSYLTKLMSKEDES